MIYPSKTNEQLKKVPFSDVAQTGNVDRLKRNVYCQYCKYTISTELMGARCGQCKSYLIDFVKSHFNDVVTGNSNAT